MQRAECVDAPSVWMKQVEDKEEAAFAVLKPARIYGTNILDIHRCILTSHSMVQKTLEYSPTSKNQGIVYLSKRDR